MATPYLTLLILHPVKLVRADYGRGSPPPLQNLWQQSRPDIEDPELLVDVAAAQGGRLGRKVWVLSADLFAQTLRLDAKSMGLSGDELRAALAFEAEPLSGVSGLEAAVAYQQLRNDNGEREFYVISARRQEIEQLRDAITNRRGRLAGVASTTGMPGGVPAGVDPFADDDNLRGWLGHAAQLLSAGSLDVPVLVPPKRPLSTKGRFLIAAGLTLAAVLVCWAHYALFAEPMIQERRAELKKIEAVNQQFAESDKMIRETQSKKDESLKQTEATQKAIAAVELQRKRLAGFLDRLAKITTADVVVTKIDSSGGELHIYGRSERAHGASEYADKVGAVMAPLGWQVQAPKSEAEDLLVGGGPWNFEVQLHDVLSIPDLPRPDPGKHQAHTGKK